MAKIKFGAMMVDASGKLGGQVFAKNRGGAYIRTKTTPLNPQTSAQTAVRGVFASISSAWSGLTDDERNSFNNLVSNYARTDVFGDLRNPSGKQLYQRLNNNLAISGQPLLAVCGLPSEVPFADVSAVDIDVAAETAIARQNGDTTGSKVVVWATPSLSSGTNFVKNKLRQLVVVNGSNAGNIDFWNAYTAKYGNPQVGANIFVGIRVINANGQASPLEVVKASIV